MSATCPRDGSELVEVERSGVRIDACRTCRGVWLDRGELEKILEAEAHAFARRDQEDDAFLQEVTGGSRKSTTHGFDVKTAEHILGEYRKHKKHKSGKHHAVSLLGDLLGG